MQIIQNQVVLVRIGFINDLIYHAYIHKSVRLGISKIWGSLCPFLRFEGINHANFA